MSEYTQGVCHDGAAILKDGQPLTIEQILEALQERDALAFSKKNLIQQCQTAEAERDRILNKLRSLNHGDASDSWHWMGDGNDHLDSLTCPILISAEDLKAVFDERDALAAHADQLSKVAEKICTVAPEYLDHLATDAAYVLRNPPAASLAHHDARILREYAYKLEADEAPDAEAGDMWDASQCAEWMREQADKAEAQQ